MSPAPIRRIGDRDRGCEFSVNSDIERACALIRQAAHRHKVNPQLALAIAIAWAWTRYGRAVNLARFFRVTSWFMAVFAVQLVVYAFHEFTEGAAIPGIDNAYWHAATEDLAEGAIAQAISLALVLVPTVWLGLAHWRERRTAPSSAAATAMGTQAAAPRAAQ